MSERRKRGPNGVAEKRRLVEWTLELDEAVQRVALARGLAVNAWVRQVVERAVRRAKVEEEAP